MTKHLLLLLLAAILVLGACSSESATSEDQTKEGVKSENEPVQTEEKENPEDGNNKADKLLDIARISDDDPFTTENPDGIHIEPGKGSIQLKKPDGTTEVISTDSPSKPLKSPDGKKAVYISPVEWEALGDLYIVNLEDGSKDILVARTEDQYTPKNVIWENDENVLVIIGYGMGTVSWGGDIYRVNIETKEKTPVLEHDKYLSLTNMYIKDGNLYYSGIKYIDDDYNDFVEYKNHTPLSSLNQ